MKVVCVLTAAGLSKRFGEDKLAYPIDGTPMGIRCLELYAQVPFAHRILVTTKERIYLQEAGERLGYEVLLNPSPEAGMSGSVVLGTEAALNRTPDGILYAVGDQPYLREDTVSALLKAFEEEPHCIWALGKKGKSGKPSVFPKTCFDELLRLTGDRGGRPVMQAHPDLLRLLETEERELLDLDIREEIL